MEGNSRKTGIGVLGDVAWGSHFCVFYQGKEDLIEILVPYFKEGLQNNEYCMWVTSEPLGVEDAKKSLQEAVGNLDHYIKEGQIEILDYSQWYTKSGKFEADKVLQGWVKKEEEAIKKGFQGLRLTGNTFWLTKKQWKEFADYELTVNHVITDHKMLAICTYSLSKCDISDVMDVVSSHQFAIIKRQGKWEVIESSSKKIAEKEIESLSRFPGENPNPIMRVSADGEVLYANPAAQEMFKVKAGDKPPERYSPVIKKLIDNKEPISFDELIGDRYFTHTAKFIPEYNYTNIYSVDITERKKAEEALKKTNQLLMDTGEMAKVGGWELDLATKEVSWTEEVGRIHGVEPGYKPNLEEAIKFYAPESIPALEATLKKTIETGEPYDLESLFIPSGSKDKIWVRSIGKAVYSGGKIVKLAGTFQNIDKYKKAEEALRLSEEKFAKAFNSNPAVIFITTFKEGRFIDLNDNAMKIFGYRREEVVGHTAKELNMWVDYSDRDVAIQNVRRDGTVRDMENKFRKKSGEIFDALISIDGVDIKGTKCLISTIVDISENKKTEAALRKSEERYRFLADNAVDLIWTSDLHLRYDYVSPSVTRIYGYAPEEMMGQPAMQWLTPDSAQAALKECAEEIAMDASRPKDRTHTTQLQHLCKDGSTIWVEVKMSFLRGPDGRPVGVLGFSRDITDRKKAEQKILEFQRQQKAILDNIPDIAWLKDKESRFIAANEAFGRSCGVAPKDLAGKTDLDIWPKKLAQGYIRDDKEVMETGKRKSVEEPLADKEGKIKWIETIKTPIFSEKGNVIGTAGIARDITERKQSQEKITQAYDELKRTHEQLIQSSKMAAMGQLAAGISHELNQPLTGIKGFAQAAFIDLDEKNPIREDLNKIVEQTNRMDKIIKNMRYFAKKSEFIMEEIEINKPIEDAIALLSEQLKVHNIELQRRLAKDLPKIQGDPNQLQQVFLNLLSNARDAIDVLKRPDGGKITLKTALTKDRKYVQIIVQDTGIGISEENTGNIFSPFFTTKSPSGGMGLGLSIAYRIIEAHQGTISFESAGGNGTMFKILLPITDNRQQTTDNRHA